MKLMMQTLARHPYAIGEVFASLVRGRVGGERIANLRTVLNYNEFEDIDIIHGHFGTTSKSFDFLMNNNTTAVDAVIPSVVSFYGYDISKILRGNPDAYNSLFNQCDAVTTLSDNMSEKVIKAGCPTEKVFKQQLAVDTNRFQFQHRQRPSGEQIQLLTIARFTEKKGLKYAIDAIAQVIETHNISYRIAGDGPLREDIETQIERHGIGDSVELLGWINQRQVKREMSNAHIFVLPSVTAKDGDKEGTPTVLLEAQATGMPVISTHHAGIPEIVVDDESGLLVPERDVDALVDALREVIGSPERWSDMGKQGRKLVESNHSIPVMIDRLDRVYDYIS
jgi:colanic acid/amylovoran biosynthesis glycosyltransferase